MPRKIAGIEIRTTDELMVESRLARMVFDSTNHL
jgi:hypothetical protein